MSLKFDDGVAYIKGEYVPLSEAYIPILDRGFVRSDATYDVAHVWDGRFFRLDDHIERFFWSMAQLRMTLSYSHEEIRDILTQCVALSGMKDAYVQMTCTRGVPPRGSRNPLDCENQFYAFAQPFVWIATPEQQRTGFSMVISDIPRISSQSIDTRIKNFHWLDLTMGILDAYDRDSLVSVLVDHDGNITEGAGFNIFSVKNGVLSTPEKNVFEGMTRKTVIEIAKQQGILCEIKAVTKNNLYDADELFITSTAGGVMPITCLDGSAVGNGHMGLLTSRIQNLYWQRPESDLRCSAVDYTQEEL
jgi:branched-chain amino acid aminotransferase